MVGLPGILYPGFWGLFQLWLCQACTDGEVGGGKDLAGGPLAGGPPEGLARTRSPVSVLGYVKVPRNRLHGLLFKY